MKFDLLFEIEFIAGFTGFVVGMLLLDLFVFHKRAHKVAIREAIGWSVFWISLALTFNTVIFFWLGRDAGLDFLAGFLIEKSLSVDNLFVFLMIFTYFKVPAQYQHRVLFWGIVGALVLRAVMIFVGAALISRFHWILYLFGVFLIYAGAKMLFKKDEEVHPDRNPLIKIARKLFPVTPDYEGARFFVRREGVRWATPLFIVLLVVETSDVAFAVDSIPAVFAITTDPLIVFTSNVFAILGLRALYFVLSDMMGKFTYLGVGLAFILAFVGAKILVSGWYKIPTAISLGVVALVMTASVAASLLAKKR
ncbi:MAG: TerC family protein [Deltaproteobacteria bacterium]|nr:TerC family protein [Deltaproteobacteria bacterium]